MFNIDEILVIKAKDENILSVLASDSRPTVLIADETLPQLPWPLLAAIAERSFVITTENHPSLPTVIEDLKQISQFIGDEAGFQTSAVKNRQDKKDTLCLLEDYLHREILCIPPESRSRFAALTCVILQELLLNAIAANPELAHLPRNTPFHLWSGITVRWRIIGDQFELCVQDPFGTLDPVSLLHSLHSNPSDVGGVGLRFVLYRASTLEFKIKKEVCTQVVCRLNFGQEKHHLPLVALLQGS